MAELPRSFPLLSHLVQLWDKLRSAYVSKKVFRDAIHWLFTAVGQRAQQLKTATAPATEPAEATQRPREEDEALCIFDPIPDWSDRALHVNLGGCGEIVLNWLRTVTNENGATPQWLSSYQMLAHFQLQTGKWGPICIKKEWMPGEDGPIDYQQFNFCQRATWMSHYIRQLGTAFSLDLKPTRRRPAGSAFPFWTRCYKVMISSATIAGLDRVFMAKVGKPITKVGADLSGVSILTGG